MANSTEMLLSLDETAHTYFKVEGSNLYPRSKEILFNYVLNNFSLTLCTTKNINILVFERSEINQELLGILSDLGINEISKKKLVVQMRA